MTIAQVHSTRCFNSSRKFITTKCRFNYKWFSCFVMIDDIELCERYRHFSLEFSQQLIFSFPKVYSPYNFVVRDTLI